MEQKKFYTIRRVDLTRSAAVLKFHHDNLTQYLWPRTLENFKQYCTDGVLFEAVKVMGGREVVAGICYVSLEKNEENEVGEFGGVYISFRDRIFDLANAIAIVAISSFFVYDRPLRRLIAHVHELNPEPRPLLKDRLGFLYIGKVKVPPEHAPKNMPKNEKGEVIGDEFEFKLGTLNRFAEWIECVGEILKDRDGKSAGLRIEVLGFEPEARGDMAAALREIATQQRS